MINGCAGLIYLNVHKAVIRPVNDPGITIWWLCCIKFGQTGKFNREFREKELERKRLEREKKKQKDRAFSERLSEIRRSTVMTRENS
jgi:hypothetical protein